MDATKSIQVLEALAAGCLPETGEMADVPTLLGDRDVIRALQFAIDEIRKNFPASVLEIKPSKRNPYREVDYFRTELFNTLSAEILKSLKKKIGSMPMLKKTENLPPYQAKARELYPRAYEPWLDAERSLLINAIRLTNDLELLSEIFQRGKGSVEAYGQKLIYESRNGVGENLEL